MQFIYKYLYKLIKSLIPQIDKFAQYLYWQERKIQMKHQKICKHKHLIEDNFMNNKIYICEDCRAFGSLDTLTKNKGGNNEYIFHSR